MKEYKLVHLNKGIKTREKDIQQAEDLINQYVSQGWILQQIISPADGAGVMIGVFYQESKL